MIKLHKRIKEILRIILALEKDANNKSRQA